MTDHSQLVKLNDLARDIPRTIDNAGTASQNTSLVDDVVTREAITLNIAAPFLIAVSERDQAIEALQARVAELEAGRRDMHRRAQRAEGVIFRCREWMRLRDEHLAQDRSEFVRQGMASFYMEQMAKPIRRFLERN